MAGPGKELWFYHVERGGVEAALAPLLEKCLERGWRALVRSPSSERLAAIDDALWSIRKEGFLPHGRDGADAARQPVLLTSRPDNPNGAKALFVLDGGEVGEVEGFERAFLVFDGQDEAAVAAARGRWKEAKAAGLQAAYWRQTAEGRWEKKA